MKEKARRQIKGSNWNVVGFIEVVLDGCFYFRIEKPAGDRYGHMLFDRVKPSQRHLIAEGAYFHVKTKMTPCGMKSQVNMIEPRRLTPLEIEERNRNINDLIVW